MDAPTKMLVVETQAQRDVLQETLGADWLVLTYEQGRLGHRVDLILFCRPREDLSEVQASMIRDAKKYYLHALKPGGSFASLP